MEQNMDKMQAQMNKDSKTTGSAEKKGLADKIGGAVEKIGTAIGKTAPGIGKAIHDLGDGLEKTHKNPNHPNDGSI